MACTEDIDRKIVRAERAYWQHRAVCVTCFTLGHGSCARGRLLYDAWGSASEEWDRAHQSGDHNPLPGNLGDGT